MQAIQRIKEVTHSTNIQWKDIIHPIFLQQYLESMLFMLGNATPSAIPSRVLMVSSDHKEVSAAQGVRRVAKDHKATPHAITSLPP